MVRLILIAALFVLGGCSSFSDYKKLNEINSTVNGYGYEADTLKESAEPPMLMSEGQKGDCEDFAYTKCLLIREAIPEAKLSFLYQAKSQNKYNVAHAALLVNDKVLDNNSVNTYDFDAKDWAIIADWDGCAQLNMRDMKLRPI